MHVAVCWRGDLGPPGHASKEDMFLLKTALRSVHAVCPPLNPAAATPHSNPQVACVVFNGSRWPTSGGKWSTFCPQCRSCGALVWVRVMTAAGAESSGALGAARAGLRSRSAGRSGKAMHPAGC